jgi:ferric-dicitrate binding protein FerR (iron transport regulator)
MQTINNSGPARVRLPKLLAPIAVLLLVVIPVSAENGVIEYLEGEVEVIGPAGTVDAEFGMAVTDGDVIATGPSGVVVLRLNDRSQVKLRENTQLRIDSVSEQTVVTLNTGGVFARVARAAAGAARRAVSFEVRTPSVVAGVRGTEFFVAYGRTVEDEPDLWLCVNEGSVDVAVPSTGRSTIVEAGEGINILAGLRTTKPRFYPWTLELNWNLDPSAGEIVDTTDLDAAYADLLDQDYD